MRLLVATRQLAFGGGAETHLEAVLPLLRTRGHSIAVIHEDVPCPGVRSLLDSLPDAERIPAWGRTPAEVVRDAEGFSPDILYCHGLDSPFLEAALVRRFRSFLYAHNYYGICISGTRCHLGIDVVPCQKRFGLGCLAWYLPKRCGGRNPLTMLTRFRIESVRRATLRRYAGILVASRYVASQFALNGIPEDRLHLVPLFPPGIDPLPAAPEPRSMTGRVLFLGRITPLKGLDHLADAMVQAQHTLQRPLRLLVAGDGPDRDAILQGSRDRGLASETLGWVAIAERNRLMSEIDLVAVPSVWPEPFGLVGLEAACVGVPAVAYASGGIPDWLLPGVTGELVTESPPHPRHLARALVRALATQDHWHSLRLGAWSRARAWTADAHLDKLLAVTGNPKPSHA